MQQQTAAPFQMERLGLIMRPDPTIPEEVEGVLNPATARGPDGELYIFPRVVGEGNYSRIGVGRVLFDESGDPAGVERQGYALEPTEEYELRPVEGSGGCEDPRVTRIEALGLYVMAYAAWGPTGPRLALAVSEDLRAWERLGLLDFAPDVRSTYYTVNFDAFHNKDAAFFPAPVDDPHGREALCLIHRPVYNQYDMPHGVTDKRPSMWMSYCALDAVRADIRNLTRPDHHEPLIDPEYPWEELRIGGGTPPVLTPHGWLMVYHGVSGEIPTDGRPKNVTYSAGALLVDERDPRTVLYRSPSPTLSPETGEETEGIVNNVVFPTGVDDRGDGRIDVYYGMADARIGAARLRVPDRLPPLAAG